MRFSRNLPRKRRRRRRLRGQGLLDWLLAITIMAVLLFIIARIGIIGAQERAGRAMIIDGDSLEIAGNRIRLRGIDAPEYLQTCEKAGASYFCGREARRYLAKLISGRPVNCSGWEVDRYDRLLGTCLQGNIDLNGAMVKAGWAVSYGNYLAEEAQARAEAKGIWAGKFDMPENWRELNGNGRESKHDLLASVQAFFRQLFSGTDEGK